MEISNLVVFLLDHKEILDYNLVENFHKLIHQKHLINPQNQHQFTQSNVQMRLCQMKYNPYSHFRTYFLNQNFDRLKCPHAEVWSS